MVELLQMWALVELLGFVCLPLSVTVFHNLPDRGWAFSKTIGMALLAFCVWLPLMYFHALPFSQLFIMGVLLIVVACNLIGFLRARHTILKVIRVNFSYIIGSELVFLGMVSLLGWVRSLEPDIRGFEMFMDEGFLAAIMRSPHFPPSDMWLAGYPINYYYYAHYTIALLAKLLGQTPSIAFNTGICIFFGLTAVNLFGVTCNIVAWARHYRANRGTKRGLDAQSPDTVYPPLLRSTPYGLVTMLMGLVLGNLAATQQWWENHGDYTGNPALFNWWTPTRVIGNGNTINEFPAFSFILSCFHAHVLTLAFTIAAIALALNLFLEQKGKGLFVFGRGWRLVFTLGITAMILGGLFAMNGWDFPTYVGLALVCIVLQQWFVYERHVRFELALDIFTACAVLIVLSLTLYAPFYLNFISPSQGIAWVPANFRSPLGDEVLIYGLFAFVFLSLLFAAVLQHPFFAQHSAASIVPPRSAETVPGDGEAHDTATVEAPQPASRRRWLSLSTIFVLVLVLADCILLAKLPNSTTLVVTGSIALLGCVALLYGLRDHSRAFTLLLGSMAFALVAFCEVVYLKDVFAGSAPRMNTVFKFYFQSWALLAITSGAGIFFILESFRPVATAPRTQRVPQYVVGSLWTIGLLLLILACSVYPLYGTFARYAQTDARTQAHYLRSTHSLDGLAYLQACAQSACDYNASGDYRAIRWLNSNISGNPVIVEAVGDDYSDYARVSAFTGLPTLMGWVGHEYQWRVNWLNNSFNAIDFDNRKADVDTIYTDTNRSNVLSLLVRYHVQYLYVGQLEQQKYPTADLHRFSTFMQVVYAVDGVTIYRVK